MRAVFEKHTILETTWLIFTRVADHVSSVGRGLGSNSPLASYRESRAATPAKAGSDDFFQYVFRWGLVPAPRAVFIEGFVVSRRALGKEDHNGFQPRSGGANSKQTRIQQLINQILQGRINTACQSFHR